MSEHIDTQLVEDLIAERWKATQVVFRGASPIEDTFNEVSKADPPDYAWYVLADVTTVEDGEEETLPMSFQIGMKEGGPLEVYCTWDYDIFLDREAEHERLWGV